MNGRTRYVLAAASAVAAGLLLLFFLGGQSSAGTGETEIVWVARVPINPGTHLAAVMLQQVRVDAPTRKLLAGDALPAAPTDAPDSWYAVRPIAPNQPLVPGRNVSTQPEPSLPTGLTSGDLRVITLAVDQLPLGTDLAGEEVDIYVIPEKSAEAVRVLERTRVVTAEEGLVALLVPEQQVSPVLTLAEGSTIKVVRHFVDPKP